MTGGEALINQWHDRIINGQANSTLTAKATASTPAIPREGIPATEGDSAKFWNAVRGLIDVNTQVRLWPQCWLCFVICLARACFCAYLPSHGSCYMQKLIIALVACRWGTSQKASASLAKTPWTGMDRFWEIVRDAVMKVPWMPLLDTWT